MKRAERILICILALPVIYLLWLIWDRGFFRDTLPNPTHYALCELVLNKPASPFRLTEVTPFKWERFFVFNPFTKKEKINSALGFEWSGIDQTSIADDSGCELIVFTNENRVVESFCRKNVCGYFIFGDRNPDNIGLTPEEAVFIVSERQTRVGKVLDISLVKTPSDAEQSAG